MKEQAAKLSLCKDQLTALLMLARGESMCPAEKRHYIIGDPALEVKLQAALAEAQTGTKQALGLRELPGKRTTHVVLSEPTLTGLLMLVRGEKLCPAEMRHYIIGDTHLEPTLSQALQEVA